MHCIHGLAGRPARAAKACSCIEKIRASLKSSDVETRRTAIKSLVHSEFSEPLREAIKAALGDSDGEVRATAATAIGNLGATAASAVPALVHQMQNDPSKEARETAARAVAANRQGGPRANARRCPLCARPPSRMLIP